ncbi:MAG: restriction endonuclease subunit S [Candidatus Bruticola sp.]
MKRSTLASICKYADAGTEIDNITLDNYISTENMLSNKCGIVRAASLPSCNKVKAYAKGNVLVSNIRPYFKKIWFATNNGGCSNDVLVFQANENTDSKFLYYLLANDSFFNFSTATSKGTKMPRGDKKAIMQYEVPIFDMTEQKAIAAVLSALDNKIEVNRAINKNLPACA